MPPLRSGISRASDTAEAWRKEVAGFASLLAKISKSDAVEAITRQVLLLNPEAEAKKIQKFILG